MSDGRQTQGMLPDTMIFNAPLPDRLRNVLVRHYDMQEKATSGIFLPCTTTFRDLAEYSELDLLGLSGMGRGTLLELKKWMEFAGLKFSDQSKLLHNQKSEPLHYPGEKVERNTEIVERARAGENNSDLAAYYGVSRTRIAQICRKAHA